MARGEVEAFHPSGGHEHATQIFLPVGLQLFIEVEESLRNDGHEGILTCAIGFCACKHVITNHVTHTQFAGEALDHL